MKFKILNALTVLAFGLFAYWYLSRPAADQKPKLKVEFANKKEILSFPEKPFTVVGETYQYKVLSIPYFKKAAEILKREQNGELDYYAEGVKAKLCKIASILFLKIGVWHVPLKMRKQLMEFSFTTNRQELLCRMSVTPENFKMIEAELRQKKAPDVEKTAIELAKKYEKRLSFSVY